VLTRILLEDMNKSAAMVLATPPKVRELLAVLPSDLRHELVEATQRALATRDAARSRLTDLKRRIARLQGPIERDRPDPRVLARAGEIESLHASLAVHREWRNELAALVSEQARLAAELAAGMRALCMAGGPEALEPLRVTAEVGLSRKEAASEIDAEIERQRQSLHPVARPEPLDAFTERARAEDADALAILPILRELARRTQVLLFTHHAHLRDLAREALGEDGFHGHQLRAAGSAST
jgi:hypothetical protein